jgi:DNA polymerase-3 subunit epsilon
MPRLPVLSPCALAELKRCLSPCDQSVQREAYESIVRAVRASFTASPEQIVVTHNERIGQLAVAERFEDAALVRDRMRAFINGAARAQRLRGLVACNEMVAARREESRWAVHVIRHGRLAAAGNIPPGADAAAWVLDLRRSAETVIPSDGPSPAASVEESECLLRWLESDGVRLVHVDGTWTCAVDSAVRFREPAPAHSSRGSVRA